MTRLQTPPVPVLSAATISGALGLLFAGVGVASLFTAGADELTGVILLLAIGLLTATWGVWQGSNPARVTAIVLGALLFVVGVAQLGAATGVAVLSAIAGASLVGLLTVPHSTRDHFSAEREEAPVG